MLTTAGSARATTAATSGLPAVALTPGRSVTTAIAPSARRTTTNTRTATRRACRRATASCHGCIRSLPSVVRARARRRHFENVYWVEELGGEQSGGTVEHAGPGADGGYRRLRPHPAAE